MSETSQTGATRDNLHPKADNGQYPAFPMRVGLIFNNDVGVRRLAQTYGEGAIKYGDKNWMKGFKESELLDHALEHIRKFTGGDISEDHLAHAVWNLFTLMWVEEKKPELMDLTGDKICNVAKVQVCRPECPIEPKNMYQPEDTIVGRCINCGKLSLQHTMIPISNVGAQQSRIVQLPGIATPIYRDANFSCYGPPDSAKFESDAGEQGVCRNCGHLRKEHYPLDKSKKS